MELPRSNKLSAFLRRLAIFVAVLGPGLITGAVNNDAGGIATYSMAGSHFGYSMLWMFIPITFSFVVTMEMAARMGVVTGKGLSDLIVNRLDGIQAYHINGVKLRQVGKESYRLKR